MTADTGRPVSGCLMVAGQMLNEDPGLVAAKHTPWAWRYLLQTTFVALAEDSVHPHVLFYDREPEVQFY